MARSADGNSPPRAGSRAPTVIDVARLAGVSKTTVSAVIREQTHVSAGMRERVLEAIDKLGYRPNLSARSLKLQRTDVLGVVAGDFFDPFSAELTAHIERHAAARGYRILLATTGGDPEAEERAVESLLEYRAAALMFIAFSGDWQILRLVPAQTPAIFIAYRNAHGPSIAVDDEKGGELATSHLVELGHRRIAYVSTTFAGQPELDAARLNGYRRALQRANIAASDELVRRVGRMPPQERRRVLRELLSGAGRPSAAFAASDITAVELMECAHRLELRTPTDLSIVGFDDIALAGLEMVSLTTVAQPIEEFARLGVGAAIAGLDASLPKLETRLIEPKLVVRRSTAPPPERR